ncbi:MAG TPA: hypothetical protein VIZ67_02660 [Acidimicrobiales bacterium]|jgi:hypothetical protein
MATSRESIEQGSSPLNYPKGDLGEPEPEALDARGDVGGDAEVPSRQLNIRDR